MALAAALALVIILVAVAAWMWHVSRRQLAGTSVEQQRRLMRRTTVVSVGTGVVILIAGLVASVLTRYWLILIPIWSYGVLHINLAVRAWLRWARRSAT